MRLASLRLLIVFVLVIGIASCGGGGNSTKVGEPAKVTLSPSSVSLNSGQFTTLGVLVQDADNAINRTADVTFAVINEKNDAGAAVGPNQNVITIRKGVDSSGATAVFVCAGRWEAGGQVCNPNPPTNPTDPTIVVGTAQITATAGSITSSPSAINTHRQVANLTLVAVPPVPGCVSQNGTPNSQRYSASAFDVDGNNITTQLGSISYASSDTNVAQISVDQGIAFARRPGRSNIFANALGVTSPILPFVTCPPANIDLSSANVTPRETSFTLAPAATKQLAAVVTDTNALAVNDAGLSYFSNAPAVATVGGTGLVTAIAAGTARIVAACAPPGCNNGTGQTIFSNPVTVTVSGALAPRVYVTGKQATSVIPIDPATNAPGTAITIPTVVPSTGGAAQQPVLTNAMFSPDGSRLYIGSNIALFIFDTGTNAFVSSNNVAIGKVLAVAPNQTVVTADPNNTQVRIFNPAAGAVTAVLAIPGATSAAFAPDGKLYIAGDNGIVAISAFATITIPASQSANDLALLNQGSVVYASKPAGLAGVRAYGTCDNGPQDDLTTTANQRFVAASQDSTRLFAVDDAKIYEFGITLNSTGCPPSVTHPGPAVGDFGIGTFIPRQLIVSQSGTNAFVLSDKPSVLAYDAATDTPSTINLAGGATSAFSGGILPDGSNLYVGAAGTNDVHRVNVASGTDAQQIAVSLKDKNNAATAPDIVVVRPR